MLCGKYYRFVEIVGSEGKQRTSITGVWRWREATESSATLLQVRQSMCESNQGRNGILPSENCTAEGMGDITMTTKHIYGWRGEGNVRLGEGIADKCNIWKRKMECESNQCCLMGRF